MSENQQLQKIMEQVQLLHKKADESEKENVKRGDNIDTIVRGLYGDPINKTPGLIDRQGQDDINHTAMIKELTAVKTAGEINTKFRKKVYKITGVGGGAGGVGGFVYIMTSLKEIKQFVIQLFNNG
jgi:hypothetical protein